LKENEKWPLLICISVRNDGAYFFFYLVTEVESEGRYAICSSYVITLVNGIKSGKFNFAP